MCTTSSLATSLFIDKSSRSREVYHFCGGYLWEFAVSFDEVDELGFIIHICPLQEDLLHRPVLHYPVKKIITISISPIHFGGSSLTKRFITFMDDKPIHPCFGIADYEEPFEVRIPWPDESIRQNCVPFNVVKAMVSFEDYLIETTKL